MSLDVHPEALLREIEHCERLRDHSVDRAREIVRSYVGWDYNLSGERGKPSPDNYIFEFISLMMGRLVADNPAAAITSPFSQYNFIADGLQEAVDTFIKNVDMKGTPFKKQLEGVVVDFLVLWGAWLVTFVEDPTGPVTSTGTRRMRPVSTHIPYWRYFKDYRSAPGIPSRMQGHRAVKDKEDLLDDPHYDRKMVEALPIDVGLEKEGRGGTDRPSRKEVVIYEVWVPDADVSDVDDPSLIGKVHGKVYTLGVTVTSTADATGKKKDEKHVKWIRDPEPFYGPADGPYVEVGAFPISGSPYTITPLQASKEQGDETTAHYMAIQESALQEKTIILVGAAQTGVKNAVKNTPHGHVVGVKGYQKGMIDQVTVGGPSAESIAYAQLASQRRDRVLGMSEALRGQPQADTSATADNIAAQANNVRVETMVGFVRDAVASLLRKVAWYMFHSEFFVAKLSEDYGKKYGLKTPVFAGGDHDQSEGLTFDMLALDIQPYSMERVDPVLMQGRVQQVGQLMIETLPYRQQFPFFNWKLFDNQIARAHNFRWLDDLVDDEALAQFAQQQQQAMAQQGQQGNAPKQPSESLNYKDAPPDIRRQIEAQAGLQPSQVGDVPPEGPARPSLSQRMLGSKGKRAA